MSAGRSQITTHVLDTALGKPAAGVQVVLEAWASGGTWKPIATGSTNEDGRLVDWLPAGQPLAEGIYRVMFDTRAYFAKTKRETFFPAVSILFEVRDGTQHYHVPLLVSPYGYSTYRGS